MNKQYKELFQMVARNGALTAEQTISALKQGEGKEKEIETALSMRDLFNQVEDKILADEPLTLMDYVQLYAGAVVSRNILEKNVNTWLAVIKEYDENLIPKLSEVAKETDETKRETLIDEFFS